MNFNDTPNAIGSKKYSNAAGEHDGAGGYKDMKPSKSVDLTNSAFPQNQKN